MGRCGFFTFLGKAPLAFPPVMLNMPWQSGPHWVMGFRREVAQEQNTGSAARDCVCSIVDFPCNRYCEYSAPGWLSLPGKVGGKCAARRSVARSHFERGNLDLDQITIRTRGRGGLDRFSGRLSGLRSRREAGAPLCDWPDRDTHFLIWTGRDFPRDASLIYYVLRYFRYTLVGFWVIARAPWLFFHFKLAERPNGQSAALL